jgi:hypothetical protein
MRRAEFALFRSAPPASVLAAMGLAAMALAGAPPAAALDYEEVRELRVDAQRATRFVVDVGAGSLDIRGSDTARDVRVTARIWAEAAPRDPERARALIDRHVDLRLESDGEVGRLVASTRDPGPGYSLPHVDLVVVLPRRLQLEIDDRSGWIRVERMASSVSIDDDSGAISLRDIGGHVVIDDSSGAIEVADVAGRVGIRDDSGSILVERVDDDVAVEDGSGSIDIRQVGGSVTVSDGSGAIVVTGVARNLHVVESGSGSLRFADVAGEVNVQD